MNKDIISKTKETLVAAASTFRDDQKEAYRRAIADEPNKQARWILETILENAQVAEKGKSPLCDDTGIPHIILEVGSDFVVTGEVIESIRTGIAEGLKALPGRPMAVKGNDIERLEQKNGLFPDSENVLAAPIMILPSSDNLTGDEKIDRNNARMHILMEGGGPEIRSKTYRVFHKHDLEVIKKEIVSWAGEEVANLGCTPCTLAVGIGRTHYEASSMMLQAMVQGNFNVQNEIEKAITSEVNSLGVGPLGLGGNTTALATFLKVGPQRASGVRIVSLRPCCCFEPRRASCIL